MNLFEAATSAGLNVMNGDVSGKLLSVASLFYEAEYTSFAYGKTASPQKLESWIANVHSTLQQSGEASKVRDAKSSLEDFARVARDKSTYAVNLNWQAIHKAEAGFLKQL